MFTCTLTEAILSSYQRRAKGPVKVKEDKVGFVADIWENCQKLTDTSVKVTMPGPMTITNTTGRRYFETEKESCLNLAECLKTEISELVKRGCKFIQIDEPVFARKPSEALDYGIEILSSVLKTMPEDVFRYKDTRIMLGVIAVCKSAVESVPYIKERIREALNYMPGDRLIVAPDCGLGLLPKDSLHQKLSNMMQATQKRNIIKLNTRSLRCKEIC
ncbi:hypothetical protein EB796_009647 [Bugula neritina]|uniref:Cobalamin-independent methionine synthase MetE C-terminal/archaeal domain-containing protein n=1 Tax=Bugula neritina TaxID=10212 RepID=A0A7J7K1I4_BUGNE|nr:hypothetical protein EB796_009647 [Bugula neritina]